MGERQPYFNHAYDDDAPHVVLVEGQADAITFGEWNIPAVALCGTRASDTLLARSKLHKRIFVLASRCIALPMRRTMQMLPVFPANFDGAALRH